MIPKILHRIVLPPLRSTGPVQRYWEEFTQLHHDWDLRTVEDVGRTEDWELGHLFARCRSVAGVADLIRLELLWRHGGIYVDADCEPLRSLDPLRKFSCFLGTEDGYTLGTGVIGAEANHPAIRSYLDAVLREGRHELDVPTNEVAGPVLASHVLRGRADVTVLPPECFYAHVRGSSKSAEIEPAAEQVATRHSYLVHRWANSWGGGHDPSIGQLLRTGIGTRVKPAARAGAVRLKGKWDRLSASTPLGSFGTYVGQDRVVVRLPDGSALSCFGSDLSLTPELVTNGVYDLPFWNLLGTIVRAGDRVVDVGANVGLFSVRSGRLVGPLGHVDSFEPDPQVASILQDNLDLNWLAERARVHEIALGSAEATLTFSRHPTMRGLSGFAGASNNVLAEADGETFDVKVLRLDDVVDPVLPIRLVKIDVEGAEALVLDGMTGLLDAGCIDFVDLEVIRADGGPPWTSLVAWMRRLVSGYGASTWIPNGEGQLEPVALDHVVAAAGHWPHVVFDLR